jgi:ABC-type amino acid transport substrate-binding protein
MQQALAAFNKGLAAMRVDGRLDKLYQRYILNPPIAQ